MIRWELITSFLDKEEQIEQIRKNVLGNNADVMFDLTNNDKSCRITALNDF